MRQHGPGAHAGRIGKTLAGDAVAGDGRALAAPVLGTGGVGLFPNAAQSWMGVSDMMPSTYRRSLGVSDRSTDAWTDAPEFGDWLPDSTALVAGGHTVSAIASTAAAAIAASGWDRPDRAGFRMKVETDISPLGWLNKQSGTSPFTGSRFGGAFSGTWPFWRRRRPCRQRIEMNGTRHRSRH